MITGYRRQCLCQIQVCGLACGGGLMWLFFIYSRKPDDYWHNGVYNIFPKIARAFQIPFNKYKLESSLQRKPLLNGFIKKNSARIFQKKCQK